MSLLDRLLNRPQAPDKRTIERQLYTRFDVSRRQARTLASLIPEECARAIAANDGERITRLAQAFAAPRRDGRR